MPATRYNKAIQLLEEGKPVFGTGLIWNGNLDEMTYFADSDYDLVMIEMEHEGLSFNNLRTSLQFLLNRKRVADADSLQADPTPVVRIPPNTREQNQWVIKQALDTGVYGLILPHLDTVEGAMSAVRAARYPQVPGVADFEPEGERGWWQRIAPRYWGLTPSEYYDAADIWPLDPDGNLLLMGIVEEPTGVRNLPDILRQVKGIGAIWAGPGDMSVALGHKGNANHPEVQEMLLRILGICKDAGVPCAVGCSAAEIPMRLEQGFSILITAPTRSADGVAEGRRLAGR
ncbi:MAG: aldolase [Chloroflexi bacterium]|nr:aldolase [Chloroflexota bacterium]MYD47618.1 aldolase [Chloroflexota bacterium]